MDPLDLARRLIDIDSTTGREAEVSAFVEETLVRGGYRVERQPVDGGRVNLFAYDDPPAVIFATHVDCVPPHIPSSVRDGLLYGRGSCDAKGILAAQIAAAERLRASGRRDMGLLIVVGEERGSDGSRAAARFAPPPGDRRYLVMGEPTNNRLASSTRGVLRVRLKATGRAAHSSFPALGESAIEKLLTALVALRSLDLPEDPEMGRTHYTIGVMAGGVAPNVIPAHAEAEVLFRTVGDAEPLRRLIRQAVHGVDIEEVLELPVVKFDPVPGFEREAFPFTTDVPYLRAWGRPQLLGPGDPHVAHGDHEHVPIAEIYRAIELYERLALNLTAV